MEIKMNTKAYHYLQKGEGSWWYRGREAIAERMLHNLVRTEGARVLDFGAGYGAMHTLLKKYGSVDAYEVEPTAAEGCRTREYTHVMTVDNELVQTPTYNLIGAFDVLEHIKDDRATLRMLYELLKPNGVFIATVPACRALWSAHDELHHHFRRYSRPEILKLFTDAGFVDVRASYWNMILFPVVYVLRLIGRGGGEGLTPPVFINWILTALLLIESKVVPFLTLPFGVSVVIVGRKP
ncbi:MAG: class I SAM-dependent methyltransferase [Candidatus Paceibacterota bacterium]|jgi:SAM-dependent methyltransferase